MPYILKPVGDEKSNLIVTCASYDFLFYVNKKHPNLEIRVLDYQKLVCEEFLMLLPYWGKVSNI